MYLYIQNIYTEYIYIIYIYIMYINIYIFIYIYTHKMCIYETRITCERWLTMKGSINFHQL